MSCGRFVSVLALVGMLAACDEAPSSSNSTTGSRPASVQKSAPQPKMAAPVAAPAPAARTAKLQPAGLGTQAPASSPAVAAAPAPAAPVAPSPALRPNVWRLIPLTDAIRPIETALARGLLPGKSAVDLPSMLAGFPVELPAPTDGPLAVHVTLVRSPWNDDSWLLHVIVRGGETPAPTRLATALGADDAVSLQFDPALVNRIRPIGGDRVAVGADGSTAQALYELTPQVAWRRGRMAPRAQGTSATMLALGTVRIRAKGIGTELVQQIEIPLTGPASDTSDPDTRFAVALAAFAQVLRGDGAVRDFEYDDVAMLVAGERSADPNGRVGRLLQLIHRAGEISSAPPLDQPSTPGRE